MLKKIFILISLVLLLNSCFWKASDEKVDKNEKIIEKNEEAKNSLATIA
jgi:hypothetical protein